jgi:hypothetical protein
MDMKNRIGIIIVVLIVIGLGAWWQFNTQKETPITTFEECLNAGYPVAESYPRQCRNKDQTFIENIGNAFEKTGLIRVETPHPNKVIKSPLKILGEARGNWFFEASFPIVLVDQDRRTIAEGIATAQSDWMTTEFVPFEAELTFVIDEVMSGKKGTLYLHKDNPSGLSEYNDLLEIPVIWGEVDQSDSEGILSFNSGVKGRVLLGPICPVMQIPPDPSCDDRPLETTVQVFVKNSRGNTPFIITKTNRDGEYILSLPPGEYILEAVGGNPFPRCSTQDIIIEPEIILNVDISCDTGIR